MNDYNAVGSYYTLRHVALFTGLSDRTLRSHISAGFLQGEKINNLWHFTREQVDAYIHHPAVRPSILAKHHALVYDFLLNTSKAASESCIILDCPGCDISKLTEFFCSAIEEGSPFCDTRCSFSCLDHIPRVILTGQPRQVLKLADDWYEQQHA